MRKTPPRSSTAEKAKWSILEPRAYSYIRFSTPEQSKGDSLRRQTQISKQYAEKHGLRLDRSLNLEDLGVSAFRGKNAIKGALAGFYAAINKGLVPKGSKLLIESLDRLSRDKISKSLPRFLDIINADIEIVSLADGMVYNVDTIDKNFGNLFASIGVLIRAHEESVTKSDRIRKAWGRKRIKAASEKKPISKRCPAWLTLTKGGYKVIGDRKSTIQRIFRMSAEGMGRRAIAKTFNVEGVEAWGDGIKSARKGNGWHNSYIQKILHNRAVLGYYQPHRIDEDTRKRVPDGPEIADYFPAVISPKEWQDAHANRNDAPPGPSGKNGSVANLFTGLVVDGYTGHVMRYSDKGGPNGRFLCSDVSRFKSDFKGQTWPYADFERLLLGHLHNIKWEELAKTSNNESEIRLLERKATLQMRGEDDKQEIRRLMDKFGKLDDVRQKIAEEKMGELAKQVQAAEAELKVIETELADYYRSTSGIKDGMQEFLSLVSQNDSESRSRLRMEIRRRVRKITAYRYGGVKVEGAGQVIDDGSPHKPDPDAQFKLITLPNGVVIKKRLQSQKKVPAVDPSKAMHTDHSRWLKGPTVIIEYSNRNKGVVSMSSLPKKEHHANKQPRDPKTGAFAKQAA